MNTIALSEMIESRLTCYGRLGPMLYFEYMDTREEEFARNFTTSEAAALLGIHPGTLRRAVSEKKINRKKNGMFCLYAITKYFLSRRRKWSGEEIINLCSGREIHRSKSAKKTMKSKLNNGFRND